MSKSKQIGLILLYFLENEKWEKSSLFDLVVAISKLLSYSHEIHFCITCVCISLLNYF